MGRKRKCEMISNDSSNSSVQTHLSGSQRSAANDRERTRMRVLSKAFVRLKTSLPWVPSDTKLSKLDTLKLATSYISYLSNILDEDDNNKSISLDVNQPIKLIENIKSSSMEKFKKFTPVVSNHYPYQNTSTNTTINNNSPNGYVKKEIGYKTRSLKIKDIKTGHTCSLSTGQKLFSKLIRKISNSIFKCWPFVGSSNIDYGERDNQLYKMFMVNDSNT